EAGAPEIREQRRLLRDVDGEPGVEAEALSGTLLPGEDAVAHLVRPALVADEVVAREQDLPAAEGVERVQLGDDEGRILHVRAVVVGEDPDVAELAEEG